MEIAQPLKKLKLEQKQTNPTSFDRELHFPKQVFTGIKPQKKCIEKSRSLGNVPMFAEDTDLENNKRYLTCGYTTLLNMIISNNVKKIPNNLYDIIDPVRHCHLSIDSDIPKAQNPDLDYEKLNVDFMKEVVDYMKHLGYIQNENEIIFYTADSYNSKKWSRHYVIRIQGTVFSNHFHCGAFMRHLQNRLINKYEAKNDLMKCPYFHLNKKGQTKFFADMAIYTSYRCFRTIFSTKKSGGSEKLIPSYYHNGKKTEGPFKINQLLNYFVQYDTKNKNVIGHYQYDGRRPFSTNKEDWERIDRPSVNPSYEMFIKNHFASQVFPHHQIWKKYGQPCREFLFEWLQNNSKQDNNIIYRRKFFADHSEFYQFLSDEQPVGIHIGGVFQKPDNKSKLLKKEFIVDVDIPDYIHEKESLRDCGCTSNLCINCSLIIQLAYFMLKYFLETKLCIKNYEFYFSGSKGLHCWIDPQNERFNRIVDPVKRTKVLKTFDYSERIAQEMLDDSTEIADVIKKISLNPSLKKFDYKDHLQILKLYWIRIDHLPLVNQSYKTSIRCPFSLNPKKNKQVLPLTDPISFFNNFFTNP